MKCQVEVWHAHHMGVGEISRLYGSQPIQAQHMLCVGICLVEKLLEVYRQDCVIHDIGVHLLIG